jgi:hypothetical protein
MTTKYVGAGLDLGGTIVTNSGSPSAATDLTNKSYVDSKIAGLAWKDEVRAATTANGTLASAFANGSVIDGVTLATADRILIKDQTNQTENGIHTVNASGAPTRATDADASAELNNATVPVTSGTVNANKTFTQTTANPTIGTSNIVFVAFSAGGTTYSAGTGLTLTSTTFAIDPAYTGLIKRNSGTVASGSTTVTIAHGFGVVPYAVQVLDASGNLVEPDIQLTSTNIVLVFAVAPTTSQYTWSALA